jgi:hypothetical protein
MSLEKVMCAYRQKEESKMSKHNYSQYSKKNADIDETIVEETDVVEETPVVEETVVVDETVVTEAAPVVEVDVDKKRAKPAKPITGVVVNCTKLNVRANPDATADVVCVLDAKSEVKIDKAKSNKEWFAVCTATGVEGYCMRKFVEASL